MRDILKLLNDHSAGDLHELNDDELRSFEALSENWRTRIQAELARRASLPHPATINDAKPNVAITQSRSPIDKAADS